MKNNVSMIDNNTQTSYNSPTHTTNIDKAFVSLEKYQALDQVDRNPKHCLNLWRWIENECYC